MMSAEERQEILELVAGGKLSAAEAATLLASPGSGEKVEPSTRQEAKNTIEVEEVMKESLPETEGKKANAGDSDAAMAPRVGDKHVAFADGYLRPVFPAVTTVSRVRVHVYSDAYWLCVFHSCFLG